MLVGLRQTTMPTQRSAGSGEINWQKLKPDASATWELTGSPFSLGIPNYGRSPCQNSVEPRRRLLMTGSPFSFPQCKNPFQVPFPVPRSSSNQSSFTAATSRASDGGAGPNLIGKQPARTATTAAASLDHDTHLVETGERVAGQ
jgi:hypothetical protein